MLTQFRLENFKSWKDTGVIPLKPITGFFGPNSAGKSSLFQALLLMKQTEGSPDRQVVFHFGDEKTPVDLGDFESVVHVHDTALSLRFSLGWTSQSDFEMSDEYSGGMVSEGDEIRFEVEAKEERVGTRRSLIVEEMSYRIPDGRRFGIQCLPNRKGYELFPGGSTYEFKRRTGGATYFPPFKFHHFPPWINEVPRLEEFFFELQYSLTLLLRDLHYLGPLRAFPHRIYTRSGAQPLDVGPAGESVVDAILSSRIGPRENMERFWIQLT